MDTTILNVGYNSIVSSLGATLDEVSWASTAYTLAGITMLPLAGWLSARFGRKRIFMLILLLFTLGSMLCGLATSATQLGLFRLVQGFGGGLLGTMSQAIFLDAYPDEYRREGFNLISVVVMVGPFLGPIVGGFVLEHSAWPALFFINVPLGVFTLWLASTLDLDQSVKSVPAKFSYVTIGLVFGALLSLQFALQSGQRLGWFDSAAIRWALFGGIALLTILILQELRLRNPMINLRLFADRGFLVGNIFSLVAGASNYGIAFLSPLFVQQVLGFSPLQAGLITIPAALAMFVGNRIQDVASRRISTYLLVIIGTLCLAVALWYNGVFADRNSFETLTWIRILQGVGFGLFLIPIGVMMLHSISKRDLDSASGLGSLIRQFGGMVGIALVAATIERSHDFFLRRLLLDVPRWPYLTSPAARMPSAIVSSISRRADVLAYQQVYALSASVMLVMAAAVAVYWFFEWRYRQLATSMAANA